ncbi:hypothetical protein K435DRAFT_705864, partial [Dendrothele bispora CBS 962.96]
MEKIIIVASQTEGLRSVFPKINGKPEEIEVVLDSGSQIVSMSSSVASSLNLHWDPTRVIHMQSANGQLQPTKGLIRNVPFEFGGLTIYLQCHVIEKPPYQVLLGRPFDTLTESTIKNFPDGEQEVTITCPNTGNKMTVSTFPRGKLKRSDNVKPTLRQQGEVALQFGLDEHGEVIITGYRLPHEGNSFSDQEVAEAYVTAAKDVIANTDRAAADVVDTFMNE